VTWGLGVIVAACLLLPMTATADLIRLGDIDVSQLASALKRSPVQTAGHPDPTLTSTERSALAAQINKKDRGRISIAVVTPVNPQQTGQVAQSLADRVDPAGVVIVVAGGNYHVTTTWGSGDAAGERLSKAVSRPGDPLADQLRRAIDSFAKADSAAGHPGSATSKSPTSTSTSDDNGSATSPSSPPATSSPSTGNASGGGGGSGGLIALIVLLVVVILPTAFFGSRVARRQLRASHWRREASADVHSQANADLVKLGEDIGALDIDSSMPNANTQGKDEYGKAIEAYQEAEQRLKNSGDEYQFAKGREALARGRQHLDAATALFGSSQSAPRPRPAIDGTTVEELQRLAKLHDRGDLSDAEFADQKRQIIGD
jgi:hypothetical protein